MAPEALPFFFLSLCFRNYQLLLFTVRWIIKQQHNRAKLNLLLSQQVTHPIYQWLEHEIEDK
jgi:hypothetical protein